ncbi:MAG: hypothetical protein ABI690_00305 [Chloroflexota bacterium]
MAPDPVNPLENLIRLFLLIFLAFTAFFGRSGGSDINPPPDISTGGAQASGSETLTVVEKVDALILESFPAQISVHVTGYQPDGCTYPVQVQQTRVGNTVSVKIYRILPPDIMCTMQLVPYDENIKLDGSFESGEYSIDVNGTVVTVKI